MTDKPKVRWEWANGAEDWLDEGTPLLYLTGDNSLRASVDGSDPKTPLQWLKEMMDDVQSATAGYEVEGPTQVTLDAYAALLDLLGGSQ